MLSIGKIRQNTRTTIRDALLYHAR